MADTVNTYTLIDGPRHLIQRYTNTSDGTGETAVQKVDISALLGPDGKNAPSSLSIEYIQYSIQGFEAVTLLWDATADDEIATLTSDGYMDFRDAGGFHDPQTTGATGDIKFTTVGTAAANDTYDITIKYKKKA